MSRCVGFPPPGFVWNGASGEALEELIRVRREAAATEKRRKKEEKRRRKKEEKRRRKKEERRRRRRRMKEEEEEEMEEGEIREGECSGENHEKSSDDDDHENQLERSSLTEEHEHPMICDHHDHDHDHHHHHHHSLYDSSDNTENIRPDFVSAAAQEKPALTPAEEESLYRDLIVNFDPPPIQTELHEFDDQEWLFARRRLPPRRHPPAVSNARNGVADDDSCLATSSLYPCLRYLPRADIYALPYTMLF